MLSFTMSPAGRMHFALTVIVAELFLSLLNGVVHAAECRIVPIKPIHCVCGVVIDLSGGRISNAEVILLKGERKLVTKQTDANGKFSFEQMEAGTYEIRLKLLASEQQGLRLLLSNLLGNASKLCRSRLVLALSVTQASP